MFSLELSLDKIIQYSKYFVCKTVGGGVVSFQWWAKAVKDTKYSTNNMLKESIGSIVCNGNLNYQLHTHQVRGESYSSNYVSIKKKYKQKY